MNTNFSKKKTNIRNRLRNNESSARAKAPGAQPARSAQVSVGDIVHVKSDGSKHKAHEFYLIMYIKQPFAYIQKFCASTLREKQYKVKLTEIYPAAANYVSCNDHKETDHVDEDEGIELYNHGAAEENQHANIRRSSRQRRQPDWLATEEIQRYEV